MEEITGWLPNIIVTAHAQVEECVREADIIVVATFAKEPVLKK